MASGTDAKLDPITFEVIRNGLHSAAREMGLTLLRTSYSPILNEGKDFSTAIFDSEGALIAQMEGCPIHMVSMGYAVRTILNQFEATDIDDGDVFILNDPYRGGMQHQDVTLIAPVYGSNGAVLLFLGVRAHHADMGGKSAGSFPGDASEQYQEGLVIPPMKFVEAGVPREDIQEFILSNVRTRAMSLGDLQASSAALESGRRAVRRLIGKYGEDVLMEAMHRALEYSEEVMRSRFGDLPDGTYVFEDYIDNDGIDQESIIICVTVIVRGSEVWIDFDGTADQVEGPLNITRSLAESAVGVAVMMIAGGAVAVNDGCLRPVHISIPAGSLLDCRHPAATSIGSAETSTRVIDVVLGALANAVPERICAGEFGSCNATMLSGTYPNGHGRFLAFLMPAGGWGGTASRDGWTTTDEPVGNCRNHPVEYLERKYPVLVEEYSLDEASAGPGRLRGGFGHVQRIVMLDEQILSTMGTRSKHPPYGLFGGWPGSTNAFIVSSSGGSRRLRSKTVNLKLHAGDRLTINTGGGGGYGPPEERSPDAVARDVSNELCDVGKAAAVYGVALDSRGAIAGDETKRLRSGASAMRPPSDGGTRQSSWCEELGDRRTLTSDALARALGAWRDERL